jgi:hypothetical protein
VTLTLAEIGRCLSGERDGTWSASSRDPGSHHTFDFQRVRRLQEVKVSAGISATLNVGRLTVPSDEFAEMSSDYERKIDFALVGQ